jgi:hypothetical protein
MKNKTNSYLIQLLSVLLISSCNFNDKKTIPNNEEIPNHQFVIPKVFFKKFRGIINNGRIINLYLTRNENKKDADSTFNCVVDDSNIDEPINYLGTILPNGYFEFKSDEEKTVLSGDFISDSKIKIKYLDSKIKKVFAIELVESKEKFTILPVNYYDEMVQSNTGDSMCDSIISYINIDMLLFESKEKSLSKKINAVIKKAMAVKINETYEDYIKTNLPLVGGYQYSKIDIIYFENNFLTLQQYDREAACGAMHGDYYISYINYDLETNSTIHLEEIFKENNLKKLKIICKQKFKEKYQLEEENLKKFYLPRDFALYRNGISFLFQPYDNGIGIYTGGTTEVFITFSEVSSLMKYDTQLTNRLTHK